MNVHLYSVVVLAICNIYQYVDADVNYRSFHGQNYFLYRGTSFVVKMPCSESMAYLKADPLIGKAVTQEITSMEESNQMEIIWRLRDSLYEQLLSDYSKKYIVAAQRIKDHVNLGVSDGFKNLHRDRKLDFIRIMKDDIDAIINDLKDLLKPNQPTFQLVKRLLNTFNVGPPALINERAARFMFIRDQGCLTEVKTLMGEIKKEIEKLQKTSKFEVPVKGTNLSEEQREGINSKFTVLLGEVNNTMVFEKSETVLAKLVPRTAFMATLIADKLYQYYLNLSLQRKKKKN